MKTLLEFAGKFFTETKMINTEELFNLIPGYDSTYVPVFFDEWTTYEENGWVVIFEKNGSFYCQEGGYCVMAFDNTPEHFSPYSITDNQALQIIEEWDHLNRQIEN